MANPWYNLAPCKLCGQVPRFIADLYAVDCYQAVLCETCNICTLSEKDTVSFWRKADAVPQCVTDWQAAMNPEKEVKNG